MITKSPFKPAWWLRNPHAQTLWPFLFRRRPKLDLETERVELPDGDFLDMAWPARIDGPVVLVLHGLEGSIHSHYAGNLIAALQRAGYAPVFMHFRGCSGEPNRKDRSYHSGDTGDLEYVVQHIEQKSGRGVDAAIGFSLGGNVLLKYLGEQGAGCSLKLAIAISVPFLLADTAQRLQRGVSRLYQQHLLTSLKQGYSKRFSKRASPLSVDVRQLKTFREFDDRVTAPLNGFRGVDHYYSDSSSRQYLKQIHTRTLILHAEDDPFMWESTLPNEQELAPQVTLEVSQHGGHVGFIGGQIPGIAHYWLESRILSELQLLG